VSKFGHIYLTWRSGTGKPRQAVGVISSGATSGVTFRYLDEDQLIAAKEQGFTSYHEFPDLNKTYTTGVLDVFKQRLFKSERSDYNDFLDFWNIDKKHKDDTLFLLAHTHGIVPTDNFEFLADFHLTKHTKFVTEITGLSHIKPAAEMIKAGDLLRWKKNSSKEDKFQVDVFTKDDIQLGWIKKIHSKIFYKKNAESLKLKVKAIDKNGVLKRVFVEVYSN